MNTIRKVKVKDLKVGDIFIGRDGVKYKIEEINPFSENEMVYWVRNLDTDISVISSSPNESKAKVVNR